MYNKTETCQKILHRVSFSVSAASRGCWGETPTTAVCSVPEDVSCPAAWGGGSTELIWGSLHDFCTDLFHHPHPAPFRKTAEQKNNMDSVGHSRKCSDGVWFYWMRKMKMSRLVYCPQNLKSVSCHLSWFSISSVFTALCSSTYRYFPPCCLKPFGSFCSKKRSEQDVKRHQRSAAGP